MLVSVQVVRRRAVSASAPKPQHGEARVVSFETTCGNAERVMVDLSGRHASLEPTGEPLYFQTRALLQADSLDRPPTRCSPSTSESCDAAARRDEREEHGRC
jgi:hypothetical protein